MIDLDVPSPKPTLADHVGAAYESLCAAEAAAVAAGRRPEGLIHAKGLVHCLLKVEFALAEREAPVRRGGDAQ